MYLLKLFKALQTTEYSLIALVCICGLGTVDAQEDDKISVILNVNEINEKVAGFWCGPNSAVNVLGAWATGAGKDLFPTSTNLSDPSAADIQELLTSLSTNMGTESSGNTRPWNIASGIRQTLIDYDVDGTASAHLCTWAKAKSEIDAGRPFIAGLTSIVNTTSVYFKHYVCVIGYVIYNDEEAEKDEDTKYSLIFHDGYGEGETDFYPVDGIREEYWALGFWDSYWQNPWYMCTIKLKEKDPAVQIADLTVVASSTLQVGQEATVTVACRTQGADKVSIDLRSVGGASNAELTKTGPYPQDVEWDSWEGQFSITPDVSGSREVVVLASGASGEAEETTTMTVEEEEVADPVSLCDASEYISYLWDEPLVTKAPFSDEQSCSDSIHIYYDGPDDDSSKQFNVVGKYILLDGSTKLSLYTTTTLGPGSDDDETGLINISSTHNNLVGLGGIFTRDECKSILADPESYPDLQFLEVTRPCSGLGF